MMLLDFRGLWEYSILSVEVPPGRVFVDVNQKEDEPPLQLPLLTVPPLSGAMKFTSVDSETKIEVGRDRMELMKSRIPGLERAKVKLMISRGFS